MSIALFLTIHIFYLPLSLSDQLLLLPKKWLDCVLSCQVCGESWSVRG